MTKKWVSIVLSLAVLVSLVALIPATRGPREAAAQGTITLKMQAAWPAGLTLYENFTFLKAVEPRWSLADIYRGMFDFMALQVIRLASGAVPLPGTGPLAA